MAKAGKMGVSSLERSPSHLLHGALQLALDVYGDELGAGAITQRQFAVLAAVAEKEGLTQTDLVRATGVDRSTLADMIARLIKKGYLGRERSADDARANTVTLTDEGRAILAEAAPRVEAADRRILAMLSAGKRDGFINQLRNLAHGEEATGSMKADPDDRPAAEAGEKPARKKKAKSDKLDRQERKKRKKARKAAQAGPSEPSSADPPIS